MILLDSPDRTLTVALAEAPSSDEAQVTASWAVLSTTSGFDLAGLGTNTLSTNGDTPVTAVAAPGADEARKLQHLSVFNADDETVETTVVLDDDGTARELARATLPPGSALHYHDGHGFAVVPAGSETGSGGGGGRELMDDDRTYFVDGSNGSDSNDGLTSGAAFETIQHALDIVGGLDMSIYDVTVRIAAGTYVNDCVLPTVVGSGRVIISGDPNNPTDVKLHDEIDGQLDGAVTATYITGLYRIQNIEMAGPVGTSNRNGLVVMGTATSVEIGVGVSFANCTGNHILLDDGAVLLTQAGDNGDYTISGDGRAHISARGNVVVDLRNLASGEGREIDLTGTPDFSTAFIEARWGAVVKANGTTFTGSSATGQRYSVETNAVVHTGGGGASYLPGDESGNTSDGGIYT